MVDTAPLLEREFAELAGLGWVGKNTLLLNRRLGSWFLLAALLTSETLVYDEPMTTGHCGTCRACIDACPTGAIVEPYRLDARKCISYLTIELREPIPPEQRESIGPRIFGCDICQDVCPFNRRVPPTAEPAFQPRPDSNPIASGRIATHGRSRLSSAIPRQPGVAGQAARSALPGRLCVGQSAG